MISATSLPEFKKSSEVVVVGYVAAEDKASKELFELLAKTVHPEYVFGITDDSALARLEGVDVPGVAVYKASDGEKNTLPLENDMDEMVADLRKSARPLIVDLVYELHDNLLDVCRQQQPISVAHKLSLTACSRWEFPLATFLRVALKNEHDYAKNSSHWHESTAKGFNSALEIRLRLGKLWKTCISMFLAGLHLQSESQWQTYVTQ